MNAHAENANGAPRNGVRRPKKVSQHNEELEASVLGGVILRNDLLDDLADLEVEDFFLLQHKAVFGAMRALRSRGEPIDTVTLEVELQRVGRIEAIGGPAFLAMLALRVPTVDNAIEYARLVRRDARIRKFRLLLSTAGERAEQWPHDDDELITEIVGEFTRFDQDQRAAQNVRARWYGPLSDFLGDDEPSDDDAEDWIIRDIIPRSESALWCGPMKGGKTWSALDVCISAALGDSWLGKFTNTVGKPVRTMGVFLEDNKRRLRRRLWELTRSRGISPNNPTLLENFSISRTPFRLPDARTERELAAEIKAFGAQLVVVDNLTRVMVGDPNKTSEASQFTRAWQGLIEATGATIVFLHHTKKPQGSDKGADPFDLIRGSGDFGAQARNIVLTLPMRTDTDEKVSEVRMRGNLDLETESFVLGFQRQRLLDRWHARLVDRGPIEQIKNEVEKAKKDSKVEKKKADAKAKYEERRNRAIVIASSEGFVSQERVAREFGLSSPGSVRGLFQELVQAGVMRSAGKKGYELADKDRQEDLL